MTSAEFRWNALAAARTTESEDSDSRCDAEHSAALVHVLPVRRGHDGRAIRGEASNQRGLAPGAADATSPAAPSTATQSLRGASGPKKPISRAPTRQPAAHAPHAATRRRPDRSSCFRRRSGPEGATILRFDAAAAADELRGSH